MLEEYDLSYLETGKLKEILKALNGARFSLKNYDTFSGIHLGDTSPYKAYGSVLSSLGYSEEEINESYYRALNCIDSIHLNTKHHKSHKGLIHLGHI
jgi:hypothetical protein